MLVSMFEHTCPRQGLIAFQKQRSLDCELVVSGHGGLDVFYVKKDIKRLVLLHVIYKI